MFTTSRYLSALALVALVASPALQRAHAQAQVINITSGINNIGGYDQSVRMCRIPLGGFITPFADTFAAARASGFAPLTSRHPAWSNPINGGSWLSTIPTGSTASGNSAIYAIPFTVLGNFAAMGPRTIDLDYLVDNSLGSISTNTSGVYVGLGNNTPTAIGTGAQGGSFTSVGHLSFDASSIINQPGQYWLYLASENGAPGANPAGISFNFYYNASCNGTLPTPTVTVTPQCGTVALSWTGGGANAAGNNPSSYIIYRSTSATANFNDPSTVLIGASNTTSFTDNTPPAAPTLTWYYVKSVWSLPCNVTSPPSVGKPYVGYNLSISASCSTDGATGRHLTFTTADGAYAIFSNTSNTMTGMTQIGAVASGPGTWTYPITSPHNPAQPLYFWIRRHSCENYPGVRDVVPAGGVFGPNYPVADTFACLNQAYTINTTPVAPAGSPVQFQWLFTPLGGGTEIPAQQVPQFNGNPFVATLTVPAARINQSGTFRCRMTITTPTCGTVVTYSNYSNLWIMNSTNYRAPASVTVCPGDTATFTVGPTIPSLIYAWRKNGATISTNPRITGINTPTLTITSAAPSDIADYTCIVRSVWCDATTSTSPAARLNMCLADFNCDSGVDFFDYLDFVDAFSSGLVEADFNRDSSIDFFDYLDFVDAFSAGC